MYLSNKHIKKANNLVLNLRNKTNSYNKRRLLAWKYLGIPFKPINKDNFPNMIIVETTNLCNLACTHCPRKEVVKLKEFRVGLMKFSIFKIIVDEISQHKNVTLRPFGDGEPLLHPELSKMIKYAKDKGISNIWLNTNGLLLNKMISKELLEAGLDQIEISIDAVNKKTYQKIRINSSFDSVVSNVINYYSLKKQILPDSKVIVSFVESTDNIHEKNDFVHFWKNKVDGVSIRPFHQHTGLVKKNKRTRKYNSTRYPCPLLWNRIYITHESKLRFCENDWGNRRGIDSVTEKSIEEIWNSPEYNKLRMLHCLGKYSEIPKCSDCTDYFQMEW